MITVPQPRVLDGNLQEVRRLRPLAASISLVAQGTGEATLTLAAADPRPAMHQWVELFTQHGSAGLYRVTGISNTYTGETQITLRHGIDTLSDSVYPVQAEEATLTVQQLLVNILSYQTARVAGGMPWQLGTCEDATSVKRAFNYDNLASLLQGLEEEKQNFYFTYDFTTAPWTLNFMRKPQDVRCEFRLTRNIEGVTVTLDDSELCTQLLLSVNVLTTTTPTSTVDPDVDWPTITANDSAVRTYDNAAAQAEWGIVQKTASIDTQDDIIGQEFPNADAWAARFMADHSQPTLQIQITGEDLSELTGDTFDELALAALCRVALPDHDALFSERVVTVTYPDVYGAPTSVTVSLANRLPRFSSSIAQAQKEAARAESTAKTARRSAGGGGGGTAKELESWAMIVKKTKESADVTGLTELSETGIILDAETGAKIYSLTQGFVSQYAELNVQSGQISTLVQATDGLSSRITQEASRISLVVTDGANPQIKTASIILAINGGTGSSVAISADKILLDGDTLATKFTALQGNFNTLISGNAFSGAINVSGGITGQNLVARGNVTASRFFFAGGTSGDSDAAMVRRAIKAGEATREAAIIVATGTSDAISLEHSHEFSVTESNGDFVVTIGAVSATGGSRNFSIAATQKYITDVAAAERTGWTNAIGTVRINNSSSGAGDKTVNLASGGSVTVYAQGKDNSGAAVYTTYGTVTVNAEAVTIDSVNGTQGTTWGTWYIPVTMTATASNGETGSNTINVDARDVYVAGYNAAPVNPTVSQCYVRSFSVSSVTKYGDGYEVVGSVTIRINYSDNTHEDYTYTVRDIA